MANVAEINRAAKHIGATELDDGRWAHYANETGSWWTVEADDLAKLCDYLDSDDESIASDAYSHWCAAGHGEEMVDSWEPGAVASYYVLTESAAKGLGVLDADGGEQVHSATREQVAAAAESAHYCFRAAKRAAERTGEERWVIDSDGDSSWVEVAS